MKILFIGTVEFSYKTLEKVINSGGEIVGVCTKKESNFNSDFQDLTPLCIKHNIPYKFIDDINSKENIKWIKSLTPDIIFCFGWSSLIKKEILDLTPMGVVGFHPAKLPQNRGRHPIIWALALGLEKTASTFFFMDEGVDSGDILSQIEFEITKDDDAKSLYFKVIDTALLQIDDFLPKLINGTYVKFPQDHSQSNIWRKRGRKDGEIDFRMSSKAIFNLVRALTKPYVGAHLIYNEENIIIWKVEMIENNSSNIEYGKVIESKDDSIMVKTYDGAIKIIKHEFKTLPKTGEYL